ncbi:MAG: hypothetical protein N3A38_01615 [Planctomycetota bacterium]|nr:hypothetical protein [Planctomycetota bacterium]
MAEETSNLKKKAREAAERRNYEYAIELYSQLLLAYPKDAEARRELRAVEVRLAKESPPSPARKILRSVVPLVKMLFLSMGKKYDGVIEECEKILRFDPGNVSVLLTLGRAAMKAGYADAAVATFEDIRTQRGGGNQRILVKALRELAYGYERQNRIKEAIDIWGEVQRYVPQDREAQTKIRDLSAKEMATNIEVATTGVEAGKQARQIIKSKEEAEKLERREHFIRTKEDVEAAIRETLEDIAKHPEDARLYSKLYSLHKQGENYEEAKKAIRKAQELDPQSWTYKFYEHDLEIWKMMREVNDLIRRYRAGEGTLKDEINRRRADLLKFRLESYVNREKQFPTDFAVAFELGKIYFEIAQSKNDGALYDEAIKRFQKTARDPKYRIEAGLRMGQSFSAKGQHELALKRFDEALATLEVRDDNWKNLWYAKGETFERLGNSEEAVKAFMTIYEIDVGFRDVAKRLEKLQKK